MRVCESESVECGSESVSGCECEIERVYERASERVGERVSG